MYGECWFTGKLYFKHGGSQNATLKDKKWQRFRVIHLIEFIQSKNVHICDVF